MLVFIEIEPFRSIGVDRRVCDLVVGWIFSRVVALILWICFVKIVGIVKNFEIVNYVIEIRVDGTVIWLYIVELFGLVWLVISWKFGAWENSWVFWLFFLPFAIIVLVICIYFHVIKKCFIFLWAGSKFGLTHISTMADLRQFIDKNPMSLTTLEEANRQQY